MSPSNSDFFSNLALRPKPSNPPPDSDKKQTKYEAAVLTRKADNEGWSEEKLTRALKDPAAKGQPSAKTPGPGPAQVESEERPKSRNVEQETSLERRQETIRTIRQAEMEGWSDEKLVAALRIRLEIRPELRARAKSL